MFEPPPLSVKGRCVKQPKQVWQCSLDCIVTRVAVCQREGYPLIKEKKLANVGVNLIIVCQEV